MAVGEGSLEGYGSYLAVGRETTFGTGVTATAQFDFISAGLKTVKETKILEQVTRSRTFSKSIQMGKVIEGEMESYAFSETNAFNYLLHNAFGGTVTSATAAGETTGGLAFTHTIVTGSMDGTNKSLSFNMRKGQSLGGKVFEYTGARVNEASFSAEIDEPLKCTFAVICKNSTQTSNDVASALDTTGSCEPLSFVDGRVSVEAGTLGAITTTSFWHVQNAEFGIANNLKSDSASRRIGSDVLDVLPVGVANHNLTLTIRFDTTTAWDDMIANSDMTIELDFQGSTLATSTIRRGIKFQFPVAKITDAGDPEVGGPDEMLTSQVVFSILRDDSSAGGFAFRALVTNLTSSY